MLFMAGAFRWGPAGLVVVPFQRSARRSERSACQAVNATINAPAGAFGWPLALTGSEQDEGREDQQHEARKTVHEQCSRLKCWTNN